jgi:aryl-alcohol dehydrogenase-like predicted oxidoreductase
MSGPSARELIAGLSDDRALEAVNLLAGETLAAVSDEEIRDAAAGALGLSGGQLEQAARAATAAETAELARLVLTAYVDAGSEAEVEQAIADTGQRALLLEIALIGVLALGLLHTANARGRKETVRESTITTTPEGQVTVTTSERVQYYTVGESVAPLAARLLSFGRAEDAI